MNCMLVYAELKPRLSVLHVIFRIPAERLKDDYQLDILKSGLLIKWNTGCSSEICFKGVHLRPPSCHSMQWKNGNELHLRLQINSKKGDELIQILQEDVDLKKNKDPLQVFQIRNFNSHCLMCGQNIVCDQSFKRVLPLPSDNWFEASETWFCHDHGDDGSNTNGTSIKAKEGDCLVSEAYFLIRGSAVSKGSLRVTQDNALACTRCQHHVGHVHDYADGNTTTCSEMLFLSSTLCLYTQMLQVPSVVERNEEDTSLDKQIEDVGEHMGDWLLEQMSQLNSFRFIVESRKSGKSKPTPYLIVWLMDVNTLLHVEEINIDKDSTVVAPGKQILKLLYKDCFRDEPDTKILGEEWRKDLTVQSIEIPEVNSIKLLNILIRSTRSLPTSMRCINNLYVGYLLKRGVTKNGTTS